MRTIMMVFLCVSCVCSFGQRSTIDPNSKMLTWSDSDSRWIQTVPVHRGSFYAQDTISVIMLVCDTAQYEGMMMAGNIRKDLVDQRPYWIKGYEVRESYYYFNDCLNCKPEYLDENKKPLSKHVLVWLSK